MESAYDRRASQLQLAVIQPSPFCNIDCKYCYLPDRTLVRRMSPKIVEQSFRFLLEKPEWLASPFVIAWHAGEPLAVPMEFYESAFVLLHRLAPASCAIENWFQTNATLITQEWCDFIKRWDVRVGVSIDGPERIHDWNRRDRAGKGTFKRVFQGTDLLKANGIEFTAIGVLSQQSLDYPEEIWRFYAELGVNSLALNFEEVEGTHRNSSLGGKACTDRARAFFETLLQLRNREAPEIAIRELDYFLDGIFGWSADFRRTENLPLCIIGIAWNGDVSTFSPELIGMKDPLFEDFVFGNVATDSLATILESPKFKAVHREIEAGVQRCKETCDYFCVCGGGQPSNKLYENGAFDSTETQACRLRIQAVAEVALNFLEKECGLAPRPAMPIRQRLNALRLSLASAHPVLGR